MERTLFGGVAKLDPLSVGTTFVTGGLDLSTEGRGGGGGIGRLLGISGRIWGLLGNVGLRSPVNFGEILLRPKSFVS